MYGIMYREENLLVETDWLENNINDPGLVVVDCDDVDARNTREHIPGSVVIPGHHYVKHPKFSDDRAAFPLVPSPEDFSYLMDEMGISNDTNVIAYDGSGSLYAARFWWALNYFGHEKVKVLNGGWVKWLAEGRPLQKNTLRRNLDEIRRSKFISTVNSGIGCSLAEGITYLDNQDIIFLDVRSEEEWTGVNDRGNIRSGHVPGAVHLEWTNFLTPDKYRTIKPTLELERMLNQAGVTPDKRIVTYCQGGVRAALVFFVLTLLGFENVRNYDGSMGEWANRINTPLVK